jgi:putative Holliday junction resolvase
VKRPARILGVDFGTKRIGLAISHGDCRIASPMAVYTRRDAGEDARFFQQLVNEEEIERLVVGLPVHMSGDEGRKAAEARAFGKWLGETTNRPVAFWDERLTTSQAEQYLWDARLTHKQRKERRDKVAAQIMLQAFLDAGCPQIAQAEPLADE